MKPIKSEYGEDAEAGRIMPLPCLQAGFCTQASGFQGIWAGQTPTGDEYAYKYSGGLGTYPVQSRPFSIYAAEVDKTFFVWGGCGDVAGESTAVKKKRWHFDPGQLLHMIAYYDHQTGLVSRPTILLDKWCSDAHDNPVISIDERGFIWIFSPSHGPWTTRSFIHRSRMPYDIKSFDLIHVGLFAYPQPWWIAGTGFAFFYTQYEPTPHGYFRRTPYFAASADGLRWEPQQCLGNIEQGHYQVSAAGPDVLGTAFDYHPTEGGLEARTNLYYLQTRDFGGTWQTAAGMAVDIPVSVLDHPALVKDFAAEGQLCYVKDLAYDVRGWPVIHYIVSSGWKPGPEGGPRQWQIARWTGEHWVFSDICTSDNNYDMGSLDLSDDDRWLLTGTSGKGPQPFNTGGEVELWESRDRGATWSHVRSVTHDSEYNHSHVLRVVNAHPDFSVFWADGHARKKSLSSLYFANREGTEVRRLPQVAANEMNKTEKV